MPMITDTAKLIKETDLEVLVKCHITPGGVRNPYGKWLPYPFHDDDLWAVAEPVLQEHVYAQIGSVIHNSIQEAFKITPGGRNNALARRANDLFTSGAVFAEAQARLSETNYLMCKPPVAHKEVVSIMRAVWNSRNDAIAREENHVE